MEIFDIIKNLETDEEIENFINHRLSMIENDEHKTIGINTDTSVYRKLLTENIIINLAGHVDIKNWRVKYKKQGSLIIDDNNIYKYLIKASKEYNNIYEAVYRAVKEYGASKFTNDTIRDLLYYCFSGPFNRPLSIKVLHYLKQTLCTERAGIAHNMFKFLGIESDYAMCRCKIPCEPPTNAFHTFNIIYPEGRDKYAIIFDSSFSLKILPSLYYLDNDKKEEFLSNQNVLLTTNDIVETIKKLLNRNIETEHPDVEYLLLKDGHIKTLIESAWPEDAKKYIYKNRY